MKDTIISVFKNLYKPNEIPFSIPLWKSLERIKVGKSKDVIEFANKADSKDAYNKRKAKLPCVIFGGEFKERSKSGLKEHSGLMVIDFDGIPSDEMQSVYDDLVSNPHLVAFFLSPSGKGYKGVVSIPKCNAVEHEKYFKAFAEKFDYNYFDHSNCNVDRVCFESYDPDIYINYDAELYNPKLEDKGYDVKDKVPLIPLTNESDIIERIMAFNWNKDFIDGEKNNFIFDVAGAFCEYGINQTTTEGYLYNNFIAGACSDEKAKMITIKSAYKKRQFDSKYFEDYVKIDAIKVDLKNGKESVIKKHNIDEETYNEIKEVSEAEDFWHITDKDKVQISPLKYKLFLEGNGFKKYYPDGCESPTFVKVESNKVEVTSTARIKDFVLNYLSEIKEYKVWNYCANYGNLFSDNFLLMLDSIDLMMLKDSISTSYLAFENGILEVKKDKVELKEYIDIDGYIWKSHILDRDWVSVDDHTNDYSNFVKNISNDEPLPIESCIGYLICTYKNRSNNKAIILNDEIITQNPEGGTGKGLFVQGISKVRKTHIIDGKTHNDKANFQNQSVSIDDKILVFDDIPKNFNFENQFSLITEGITIRKLYSDPIKLSVQDSPKIVLSTNYAVKGEGNSHDRRRHEVEIAQYYGKNLTPEDEFGRQLFDEWTEEDFNKFDNYMVYCIQVFLKDGLIKQNTKNLKVRKFIAETSMEFYEWANEVGNIPLDTRTNKIMIFEKFIGEYNDFNKWLTRRKFNIWIQKWSSFNDYKYSHGVTHSEQWFDIETGKGRAEEEIEF